MSSDTDGVRSARSSRRLRTALVAAGVAILAIASLAGTAVGASSHQASASRVTWTKGHPWTGAAGKAETVQHMMARARRTPPSVREFGRLPEVVR
ncbi:MAG TPA: hypothetical protein VNN79_10040, partial [Actinomycetota bacterium]|nr:hypothetical protein [Actinomycetota bacterium]